MERALFAGRARAAGPANVPSLDAVLRAVDRSREAQETRRARGRAFVGMALAAACVATSVAGLPHVGAPMAARDRIVADLDASATSASVVSEPPAAESCEREEEMVAMSTEPPACYAPPASFTVSTRHETDQALTCGAVMSSAADESCGSATP
jgi:hypothetical protein